MVTDPFMSSWTHMLVSKSDVHWILGNFGPGLLMNKQDLASPKGEKVIYNKTSTEEQTFSYKINED